MAQIQPLGATEAASENALGATEVDRRLRKALRELQLAERTSVLWFAEVAKRKLYKDLGFSSIYQYASEALGFSRPRTAQFIRLCESLEGLPALKDSVAAGDVSWTKAREVAKVATPQTESAWVDLAQRESRRKLERRVRMAQTLSRAKRRSGGRQLRLADSGAPQASVPSASPAETLDARTSCSGDAEAMPPDVTLAAVPVSLSLRFTPEQYARYEAILEQLRKHGERGTREELILAGLQALLVEAGSGIADPMSVAEARSSAVRGGNSVSARGGNSVSARGGKSLSARVAKSSAAPETTSATPRDRDAVPPADAGRVSPRNHKPAYQIILQQCEDCGRARVQTSRGAKLIEPATAEAMHCDARIFRPGDKTRSSDENRTGDKNGPGGDKNRLGGRNLATIPPGVRREVMARDGYRCRAPGCGSARFLEVHHVVPRATGGSNRPDNLVTLCSACHRLTHSHPPHTPFFPAVEMSASPGKGAPGSPHPAISASKRGSPLARGSRGSSPHQPPGSNPTVGGNGTDLAEGGDPKPGGNGADSAGGGAGRSNDRLPGRSRSA